MNKKQISGIIAFLMILSSFSVFADRIPPINTYEKVYQDKIEAFAVEKAKASFANDISGMNDAQIKEFALANSECMNYGVVKAATYKPSYTSGETEHIVNGADFVESDSQGATLNGDAVEIQAGGKATFGFFVPYSTRSVTVVYTGGGELTLETEQDEYNPVILEEGTEATYKIEFGKNLGKDLNPQYREWGNKYGILQEYVEHGGEKTAAIIAGSDITIHELRFEKEITMGYPSTKIPQFSTDPSIQEYETELMSTVLIHENASVIVVNGATRYVDNNHISKKPYNLDGSLYLPVNTLAKALGYYGEAIHDKGYALMRNDNYEVVMMGSDIKVTKGLAESMSLETPAFVYREGEILAGVRYFAELCGKTVDYKDGLVVIDDKYTTRDVLTQDEFYSYAKSKFDAFMTSPTIWKTYYVSTNGKANNSGTSSASPWNLETALKEAEAGDTVILEEGTYREVLAPQNGGSPNSPVTYKAAEGARVVISAAEEVSAAPTVYKTVDGNTVYKFDVTGTEDLGIGRNQIFIDGEMQREARYPDGPETAKGLSKAWPVRGDIFKVGGEPELDENGDPVRDANNKVVYIHNYDELYSDTLLNQEDNYWQGGVYVGTFGNSYAVLTGKIASSSKGKLVIDKSFRTERWWDGWSESVTNGSQQWNYGMIVGHMNALNLPGEWIREGNNLYMILPEGKTTTAKIEVKARQAAIDLTGKSYINIEGIETFAGGVTMHNSEMCMLNGVNMKYISHYTLNSDSRSGYIEFPFQNMAEAAPEKGEVGVYVSGKNNIIVNSKIDHSASAGIFATGLYGYFENNIINDCGYMGSYASGILCDVAPRENVLTPVGGYGIYNNTVYNSGRSLLCFAKNTYTAKGGPAAPAQGGLIFIPADVAYNDFHDACLLTEDGGAIYSNGTVGGFDKKLSTFRNNYVYRTTTGEDMNPYNALLYWDGDSNSYDSYNNLLFETGDMSTMLTSIASAVGNESYDRLWNNQMLGALTLDDTKPVADALLNEYFSEDRPFFAGSDLDRTTPYMNNYNRFTDGLYTMQYEAKDAVLSEGVTVSADDGYATFTENGQYIDFKNVDFGDGANEMVISYFCDSNWTYDDFEITVYDGDDVAGGKTFKATAPQQDAPNIDKACTMRFMTDTISGVKNVRVKVTAYYSARIGGIGVYKRTKIEETDAFSLFTYPLEYSDKLAGAAAFMTMSNNATSNPHQAMVSQIWNGHILRYDDQTVTDVSDYFVIAAGRSKDYKKTTIKVYVCDADTPLLSASDVSNGRAPLTLVADFRILKQHINDMEPVKIPLKTGTLAAGKYDIYFVFGKDDNTVSANNSSHTSLKFFGFLKQGEDTSAYSTETRYQGAFYDESISVQNAETPFKTELLTFTDLSRKKLLNTLPGTTAGYSDIDVLNDTDKLTIGYYATDEYDGQGVTVRVVGADNTEVARGTFTTNVNDGKFTGKEITLDNTVPAGNYKVCFDFGGSGDMTCQLGWFRFGLLNN